MNASRTSNWIISVTIIIFGIAFFADIFLSFLPQKIKNERVDILITLLLFQVGVLVIYLLTELPSRNSLIDGIEKNTNKTSDNLKSVSQTLNTLSNASSANLLTGEALSKDIFLFDGFNDGEYFAVNAPLQFEQHNKVRRQIDIHLDRYKSNSFDKAHYSYPILNSLDNEQKRTWIEGILRFLKQLSQENLTDAEKRKLLFYVPENEHQSFKSDGYSYFIGSKVGVKQCLLYLHQEPYFNSELRKPKSVFIIYKDVVINSIQDIINNENVSMKVIEGIDAFVKYCEQILSNLSSKQ